MGQEGKHRKYSKEFRDSALRRWEISANVSELCQELGISRTLLYWWRECEQREQEKQSQAAEQRLRRENTHLKKALAKKTLEVDFLKVACEKVEALHQANWAPIWKSSSTTTTTGSGSTQHWDTKRPRSSKPPSHFRLPRPNQR